MLLSSLPFNIAVDATAVVARQYEEAHNDWKRRCKTIFNQIQLSHRTTES